MPQFFQYLAIMNPLRHYIAIIRDYSWHFAEGGGVRNLMIHAITLTGFAVILLSISINCFRSQLS